MSTNKESADAGILVISKSEAASKQLKTAIWLWFHEFDLVPIHALAASAYQILRKLHAHHKTGYHSTHEDLIDLAYPKDRKAVANYLNATANFIKHADKDPEEFHSFSPDATQWLLLDVSLSLTKLTGELSTEQKIISAWGQIHYPEIIDSSKPELIGIVSDAIANGITKMSKPSFYKNMSETLAREIAQAARHRDP